VSPPAQQLPIAPVDGVGETATIIGRRANPCEFSFPRGDTCAVRTLRTEQRVNASASSDRGSVRRAPVLTFQETPARQRAVGQAGSGCLPKPADSETEHGRLCALWATPKGTDETCISTESLILAQDERWRRA
jgi:hypothetical protein